LCASSSQPEWAGELPDIKVYGRTSAEFGFDGPQCGRTISPAIEPAQEGTLHTLRMDLTRKNSLLKDGSPKILANSDMATLCHDLSVISEEEYRSYVPPSSIDCAKAASDYPLLEYCGGYDNGWIGKKYRIRLASTANTPELVLKGLIPKISSDDQFKTDLTVLIDGNQIHREMMKPGYFEIRIPGLNAGSRWIELRYSDVRQYVPDTRWFSAQLTSIGFESVKMGK
jgi:hypothetical protein